MCRIIWLLLLLFGLLPDVIAVESAAQSEAYGLVALNTSASSKCAAGPLKVLVRISSCFDTSEVVAIDNWVTNSVRASTPTYYVDGVAVVINYYARLENPVAPSDCDAGTTKMDATTFRNTIKGMSYDNPASLIASPDAVLRFVKDNGELGALSGSQVYSVQFRLCDWSCAVLETDKVLSTLDELNTFDPMSLVRFFPCYRTIGAVGVSYVDSTNKQQCACVCPVGTALSGTSCISALTDAGRCSWNTNRPAGYTCDWTKSSTSALKLVSDCRVDVILPHDNYVADGRINKNDKLNTLPDPKIAVVSTLDATSLVDTWQQYLLQPQLELDKIAFRSFGVYNLSLSASDYTHEATCDGCVAVVDKYPPHAVQACATSAWGSKEATPTDLTLADLQTASEKETSFHSFSSTQNVVNNGPSERVDDVNRTMKDWTSSTYTNLSSDSASCFHDFVVRDLLVQPALTQNPLAPGVTAVTTFQCVRCCSKKTTLREYYYDYKCGSSTSPPAKAIAGTETCSFNHCMRLKGSALVQASASTTNVMTSSDATAINRVSPWPTISSTYPYTETLSSLVDINSTWGSVLPNQDGYLRGFNVSAYVFWRFKKGTDTWALWNDSALLEFTAASTPLVLQAWTQCGMAKEVSFSVAVSSASTFPLSSIISRTPATPYATLNHSLLSLSKVSTYCLSNETLVGFALASSAGANAYYTSKCAASSSLSSGPTKYTSWTSVTLTTTELSKLNAHTMDCGTAGINSFKLETSYQTSGYNIRYSYTCSSPLTPMSCNAAILTGRSTQGDGAFYLDRPNVVCPADTYLAKTQLMYETVTSTNVWYQSTCCYYQNALRTRMSYGVTVPTSIAGLASLQASCLSGEAMNSFALKYLDASYSSSCLADQKLSAGPQFFTNWGTNNGSIFALTSHVMDCGSRALGGFQLEAQSGQIRYAYSCTKTSTPLTTCVQLTTASSGYTGNATDSLDSIPVACASDYLLTKIQLQMQPAGTSAYSPYYRATCCQRP